jgi:hypothetical protein
LRCGSPTPLLVDEKRLDIPGSWRTLVCLCPGLRPRQDRRTRPLRCADATPATGKAKAPAMCEISGLNPTASALAVYASPRRLPGQDARLASRCWPDFTERDWLPAGFVRKVSAMLPTSASSFPRLCLAQTSNSGRVEKWRGGLGRPCVWPALSVAGARVAHRTPFPLPPHRTGRADFPHPALGQGIMRSHTRG